MQSLACAALICAAPLTAAVAGETPSRPGSVWYANDGSYCMALYDPVCAVKDGVRFTYSNSCYARRAGARVISDKACGDAGRFPEDRR
jgi:hypothetical protein